MDEEPVAFDELPEGVSDGVTRSTDPYGLHHSRVPQLAAAQLAVEQLHGKYDCISRKFINS